MQASSSITNRTANWPLVCRVRSVSRANQGGLGRSAQNTAAVVIAPNAASSAADSAGRRPLSSSATAITGPNSPTAPNAEITVPNRPRSSPLSRSIGSTVPSVVLVSAVPMTNASKTSPPLTSSANAIPATRATGQDHRERRRVSPRTAAKSIS